MSEIGACPRLPGGRCVAAVVVTLCLSACSASPGGRAASSGGAGPPPSPAAPAGSLPAVPAPSGPPQPGPGAPLSTVPEKTPALQVPVPITATGDFGNRVTVEVSDVSSLTSAGNGPGQISGEPAAAVVLRLTNASARSVSLENVTVTAGYGRPATPAGLVDDPRAQPFGGEAAPGASAAGTYVFAIPTAERDDVTLTISYSTEWPTVVLTGALR